MGKSYKQLRKEFNKVLHFRSSKNMTRTEIENKAKGIKLRIAKLRKEYSKYPKGKENNLTDENIIPLQNELLELNKLWGNANY